MKQIYSFDETTMPIWIKVVFLVFYLIIFFYAISKTVLLVPKNKRKVNASSLIVLYFTIYAMFYCVNPDYFSYRDWMNVNIKEIGIEYWTNENIYAYLITFCQSLDISYPYELFRLIVWGGGLLVLYLTSKMYRSIQMPGLVVMFLFVLYSGTFSYGRVSLAMAVYFMGVSILMWGKSGFVKLLGIALALSSYFCHHQMIIGIGLLPGIILPFEKKKTIVFALTLLGMMMAVIYYINSNVSLMETVFGADELAQKMETYNEREQGLFRMSTAIGYINIFLPFVFVTYFFYQQKQIPKPIVGIHRITFLLIMATVAFFVVSGSRSTYTYRVLYINIIPVSILVAYCFNQGYFKSLHLLIMFGFALLTNSMRLINSVQ